ncbi:MAG: hypothetical protein LC804_05795 [Acidobacteria bacterium]|nr:hypothetical protein [Acidobacteriota bacterium]
MQQPTTDFVRTLAAANGIQIPEERLELVRRQYDSFMRTLEEINSPPLPPESEPAFVPILPPGPAAERGK